MSGGAAREHTHDLLEELRTLYSQLLQQVVRVLAPRAAALHSQNIVV